MEHDADPALQFFPDGKVDLYGALGVDKEASQEDIKKAYRRSALRYHPDKVLSSSSTSSIDPHQKFQQINFAYSVLSDETRRKRYDSTGSTKESIFEQNGFSWDDYFKEMWQGNVSGQKLDEFKKQYQNSDEERQDLLEAYESAKGDLETIFTYVPCSEVLEDEERFVSIITEAIRKGEIDELPKWKKSTGDKKGREKMRNNAKKEASEAEAYARELGVWDDLFGKGRTSTSTGDKTARKRPAVAKDEEVEVVGEASSDEEEGGEEDEEDAPVTASKRKVKPAKSEASSSKAKQSKADKSRATSGDKKGSTSKPKNGKEVKNKKQKDQSKSREGDEGMDGLRALMMKRGEERSRGFDAMISRLEASADKGGKNKKKGGGMPFGEPQRGEDEPDEEAFLKAREAIDARKRKAEEGKGKGEKKKAR